MQWTDESGRPYGEDPYGGGGYPYAHGYGHGRSATTDTASMPWDAAQLAQWEHPGDDPGATGPGPYAAGAQPYATGAQSYAAGNQAYAAGAQSCATGTHPAPTAWDASDGNVLPHAPHDDVPTEPLPGPDAPASESVRPVFVDPSGRRQRRVLRAARLLLIPAGGYVALLISAALGGPSLDAPFVPQPDPAHRAAPRPAATEPDSSPGTGRAAVGASPATGPRAARPVDRPTAAATAAAASASTAAPTATTAPTPTRAHAPATSPAPKGRAIGSSHKPVK